MWSIESPVTVQPNPAGTVVGVYLSHEDVLTTVGVSKPPLVTSSGPLASAPWAAARNAASASASEPAHLSPVLTPQPPFPCRSVVRTLHRTRCNRGAICRTELSRSSKDGVRFESRSAGPGSLGRAVRNLREEPVQLCLARLAA